MKLKILLILQALAILSCSTVKQQKTAIGSQPPIDGTTHIVKSEQPKFIVHNFSLPKEIEYDDNQFSGLAIQNGKLFLMSESRLQDHAEAKLYAIALSDLDYKMVDTSFVLPYKKFHICHLEALKEKMEAEGQVYEGLEAIVITNNEVYLSVETDSSSTNCYLLKGCLNDTAVIMNPDYLIPLHKPTNAYGRQIYNAGFEAMAEKDNKIIAFFEYNSFPTGNYVYSIDTRRTYNQSHTSQIPVNKLPFRITDITSTGRNHYTAINYFYKGAGPDTIYRTPDNDSVNNRLIKPNGVYRSYCRLIDIEFKNDHFAWKPLWEFPEPYMSYNWEGMAPYKNGFFIINDKFTAKRPYQSTLLYLQKTE